MNMLDPFYGISESGNILAKWLNRILLIGELSILWELARYQIDYEPFGNWIWFVAVPLSFSAIGVVNSIIRQLWNIIVVIRYGTADPEQIASEAARQDRRLRLENEKIREARHLAARSSGVNPSPLHPDSITAPVHSGNGGYGYATRDNTATNRQGARYVGRRPVANPKPVYTHLVDEQ